jgi:hypothetical protein
MFPLEIFAENEKIPKSSEEDIRKKCRRKVYFRKQVYTVQKQPKLYF